MTQRVWENPNAGRWFSLENHIYDLKKQILRLKKYPEKFLLGESMGGAIALSLLNHYKTLPINGCILVALAIGILKKEIF